MLKLNQLGRLARQVPGLDRALLLARGRSLAKSGGYPEWRSIVASEGDSWQDAHARAVTGQKVLIATSTGGHLAAMQMETVLAAALTMRGAKIEALLCDAALPGCQMCEPRFYPNVRRFIETGPKDICSYCYLPGRLSYETLGIMVQTYSEWLPEEDIGTAESVAREVPYTEIENFSYEGLAIGQHAKAGALRFYARATIEEERYGEEVLRRYLKAAMLTALAARRLFAKSGYSVVVLHHGIYVPQGLIVEAAKQAGVRVVTWHPAYRQSCFIFSHDDTYHHTLMNEPVSIWENMHWDERREKTITGYLRSRWQGDDDWIKFVNNPIFEKERILSEVGLDSSRPIIGCLTNVMWDAQLHYPANAFPNMLEWLLHTVRYFANRPELQLIIRVHPAEIRGSVPTKQPVVEELAKHFPQLPPNVFVVEPESEISTYVISEFCDAVIIYGTKTGVELTSSGIPVIVAGEAWIRGKGMTIDATSAQDYDAALDTLPLGRRLPDIIVQRARKYAYHFFFRRMIPVPLYEKVVGGWPPYRFRGVLDDLKPGRTPGLDLICDGILNGTPFVYDEASRTPAPSVPIGEVA